THECVSAVLQGKFRRHAMEMQLEITNFHPVRPMRCLPWYQVFSKRERADGFLTDLRSAGWLVLSPSPRFSSRENDGTTSTGPAACRTVPSATLPMNARRKPVLPCVEMTIRSTSSFAAAWLLAPGNYPANSDVRTLKPSQTARALA